MAHKAQLSQLETTVMDVLWQQPQSTAEEVRAALEKSQKLKDSTIRTILRRLEEKGYVEHVVAGRTYVYCPRVKSQHVATDAVRRIIKTFCRGSVENLVVGMVDDKILTPEKLKELAKKIADAESKQGRKRK